MNFIRLGCMEMKKLFLQREIYIALFLCTVLFAMVLISIGDATTSVAIWKELASIIPYIGFWFIAVLIVVGIARCLPFEREQNMDELLLTYKKGRLTLLIIKQLTIFIYCAVVALYFYIIAFIGLTMKYDVIGLFAHVELDPPFLFDANPNWTFARLLIYEYGYTVLGSYIFALFTLLLSLFIKRSVFIMMIAGGIFALGEIYEKFIESFIGTMKLSEYIGVIYDYGFNGMLSYRYLDTFSPFSEMEVYILFMLVALLLFTLNLLVGRWKRNAWLGD